MRIWDLVPGNCVRRRPSLGLARWVEHDITVEGDMSLVHDIVSEACGRSPEEAVAVLRRYLVGCWFRERREFSGRNLVLVADLSDGRRKSRVTVRARLGPFTGRLLEPVRGQLERYCAPV